MLILKRWLLVINTFIYTYYRVSFLPALNESNLICLRDYTFLELMRQSPFQDGVRSQILHRSCAARCTPLTEQLMELNSVLSFSCPPPPRLCSPHALRSCSACCWATSATCISVSTLYYHQPLLSVFCLKTNGWLGFTVSTHSSVVNDNFTSGWITHPVVLSNSAQSVFPVQFLCVSFASRVCLSCASLARNFIWAVIDSLCNSYSIQACRSQHFRLKVV